MRLMVTFFSSANKIKPNYTVIFVLLLAVITFVYLIQNQDISSNTSTATLEPIVMGLSLQPTSALAMIAQEKNFFNQQGLSISMQNYPSGKRALLDGLLKNQVDIVTTADVPVTMAGLNQFVQKEYAFKVIAGIHRAENVNRIIARKSAGINSFKDLKNKRVGTQRSSAVHYFLYLALLENGISSKDIQLKFYKAEHLAGALANNEIDAFSMREPYISLARQLLGEDAIIFQAPGIYNQQEVLVARSDFIDHHTDLLVKLLNAMLQAEAFAQKYPQLAIEITARYLNVSKEKIASLWPDVQYRISLEQSLLLGFEHQARWAIKENLSLNNEVPDYMRIIYLDALKTAKPSVVSVIH